MGLAGARGEISDSAVRHVCLASSNGEDAGGRWTVRFDATWCPRARVFAIRLAGTGAACALAEPGVVAAGAGLTGPAQTSLDRPAGGACEPVVFAGDAVSLQSALSLPPLHVGRRRGWASSPCSSGAWLRAGLAKGGSVGEVEGEGAGAADICDFSAFEVSGCSAMRGGSGAVAGVGPGAIASAGATAGAGAGAVAVAGAGAGAGAGAVAVAGAGTVEVAVASTGADASAGTAGVSTGTGAGGSARACVAATSPVWADAGTDDAAVASAGAEAAGGVDANASA